jgi:hypothetical protein
MRPGRSVVILFLVAVCLYLVSYPACREGDAHDQSGFCVIDPFMPPPYLGFEYWSQVGLTLGVVATGLLIAAVMLWRNSK